MKSNNRILGIIFFCLLALLIAKKTILKPTQRSFKQELTSFDAEAIDKVTIQLENQPETVLTKANGQWSASNGTLNIPAKEGSVSGLLRELANIKTKQLVSRNTEKWNEYEVDETKGRQIDIYSGGKKITGLTIGRFNFNQQTRSGISYARLSDEDDIYALDGFLSMTATKDFNSFRDGSLMKLDPAAIEKITVSNGEQMTTLSKTLEGQWLSNDLPVDSTITANYISALCSLSGKKFNDDFSAATAQKIKTLSLGDATIEAYLNPAGGFVLKSNKNDAYFNSDSLGIFKKAFLDFDNLK